MAEYIPVQQERYVERDTGGSSAGFWAVLAVIIVVLALLLFGTRLFGRNGSSGTNINGTINVPGSGSGSTGGGTGSTGGSTGTY